jgi:uncharacterized protein
MSTGPDTPQPPQDPGGSQPSGQPPPPPEPSEQPREQPPAPSHGPVTGASYGGPGQAPPPGYWAGPPPMRPDEEKIWAIGAHLGPLVLGVLAPLIVWLVFRERSAFLDRTGKEALNMQISYLVYGFAAGLSILLLVGIVLLPIVVVAWFVLMIVATVKVANLEEYRYPAIIRFIS